LDDRLLCNHGNDYGGKREHFPRENASVGVVTRLHRRPAREPSRQNAGRMARNQCVLVRDVRDILKSHRLRPLGFRVLYEPGAQGNSPLAETFRSSFQNWNVPSGPNLSFNRGTMPGAVSRHKKKNEPAGGRGPARTALYSPSMAQQVDDREACILEDATATPLALEVRSDPPPTECAQPVNQGQKTSARGKWQRKTKPLPEKSRRECSPGPRSTTQNLPPIRTGGSVDWKHADWQSIGEKTENFGNCLEMPAAQHPYFRFFSFRQMGSTQWSA